MSVLPRPAFLAWLFVVLAPFALPGPASAPDGGAGAVAEAVQVRHEAHPASWGVRGWLPDAGDDRLAEAPFAPAHAAGGKHPPTVALPASADRSGTGTDPLVLLPPARAPPTFS